MAIVFNKQWVTYDNCCNDDINELCSKRTQIIILKRGCLGA